MDYYNELTRRLLPLEEMTDAELAAIAAQGTPYTPEELLSMDEAEHNAFLEATGNGWMVHASDAELEAFTRMSAAEADAFLRRVRVWPPLPGVNWDLV